LTDPLTPGLTPEPAAAIPPPVPETELTPETEQTPEAAPSSPVDVTAAAGDQPQAAPAQPASALGAPPVFQSGPPLLEAEPPEAVLAPEPTFAPMPDRAVAPAAPAPLASPAPAPLATSPATRPADTGFTLPLKLVNELLARIGATPLQSLGDLLNVLRILGLALVAGIALRLASATLGAIDDLPLVGGLLELVGLVSLLNFLARNAFKQQKRAELLARIQKLRTDLLG
jgi:hypothetical protein